MLRGPFYSYECDLLLFIGQGILPSLQYGGRGGEGTKKPKTTPKYLRFPENSNPFDPVISEIFSFRQNILLLYIIGLKRALYTHESS